MKNKKRIGFILGALCAVFLLLVGVCRYAVQTSAFMDRVAETSATAIGDTLGVPVDIGKVQVNSLHEIEVHNVAVYDKQAELVAKADKAVVSCRLFSALRDLSPAEAVDTVTLSGVEGVLTQREDGSWNIEDIQTSSSSGNSFTGRVILAGEGNRLTLHYKGQDLTLDDAAGTVDFADYPVWKLDASGTNQGAAVKVTGSVTKEKQVAHIQVSDADLMNYVPLIPEGTLPEAITPVSGHLDSVDMTILSHQGMLSYTGSAVISDGAATVRGIDVTDLAGKASFTDQEIILAADVKANEQPLHAEGRIWYDTGTPYLDLRISSDAVDPAQILTNIPYAGAAAVTAHVTGSATNPSVEGDVEVPSGEVMGVSFTDAAAHIRFADQTAYISNLSVQTLGGTVNGEGVISASNLAYTAHLKGQGVDLTSVADVIPSDQLDGVSGLASFDVGLSGTGTDVNTIQAYGSASLANANYKGLPIEGLSTSFAVQGDNVTVDYLSARLPNRTTLGVEGKITSGSQMDFAFYGGHVDLSLVRHVIPEADITGLGDFKGTLRGDISDPHLDLDLSANRGTLFKQPFDSLVIKAGGGLDGVTVDNFSMEKDGKETWIVEGTVGLIGDRRINMRIDTIGARMEDIAALVAPDQPITGNVDNTIRLTGTLDNPSAVGYIHFYRGSYRGILLSGMDGDYFIDDGVMRLQDFHIYSPMVDMDLNGTIDTATNLDMVVAVHDIDMKRFQSKFPYEVSGHGTFDGKIGGTLDAPTFNGMIDLPSLVLNGQTVNHVHGLVNMHDGVVSVDNFGFDQNEGTYDLVGSYNMNSDAVGGNVVIQNADINAVCAILNQKNKFIQGRLTSGATVGGTLDNPTVDLHGSMDKGTVGGYDVHDVTLAMTLRDHLLNVDTCTARQGDNGTVSVTGTASLDGPLDLHLAAQSIELGMFTKAAGIGTAVSGTADITADVSGTLDNPAGSAQITAHDGGINNATFDTLQSSLQMKNGQIQVDELTVDKTVNGQKYQAGASGIIPLSALSRKETPGSEYEQIHMEIALENADLSLLPALSHYVESAEGPIKGSLQLRGTADNPLVYGSIAIPDGTVKLRQLATPITSLHLDLNFNGDAMTVRDFSGKMGKGTFLVTGGTKWEDLTLQDYQFDLSMQGLDVESSFFKGPLDGTFTLSEGTWYGLNLPKITGSTTLHDCTISVPSLPDTDGELPDIILDVSADAGRHVRLYSSSLYDMTLTGGVHFGGTTRHPQSSGTVSVMSGGTLTYLKTVFRIREGTAYFNQIDSFLPEITFNADTKLASTKVMLAVKGPLNHMEINLTSQPELSQTEIIKLLTLREAYRNGERGFDAGDALALGLQMSFLADIEDSVRDILYLDTFTVARGSGSLFTRRRSGEEEQDDEDVYNIQLGKYIVPDKVMLRYTQSLGGNDSVHQIGLQYEINDHMGIGMARDGSDFIIGAGLRISF